MKQSGVQIPAQPPCGPGQLTAPLGTSVSHLSSGDSKAPCLVLSLAWPCSLVGLSTKALPSASQD